MAGTTEGQRLAANLALKGFVVLAFDPVGQGEREQTYDRRVDRALAGWSVPEHIQAGAQSVLIGESVARYFIWDATRIGKVWLDRTPYSLRAALENAMNTDLFDAVIPGFALHWDLDDLRKAMGNRSVLWTDPTNWMGRPVPLGPPFQYRYILGDDTDLHDAQDDAYVKELLR